MAGAGAAVAIAAGIRVVHRRRPVEMGRRRGLIVGSMTARRPGGLDRHAVILTDAHGQRLREIPINFRMHGFTWDPLSPGRAVVFEKKGAGCVEVDLVSGARLRTIPTVPGRRFYGHGTFTADGAQLLATETVLDGKSGVIGIRDGRTFEVLGELPSYGKEPHDCQLVDDGRTLAITNGGGALGDPSRPGVSYVDVASAKLLETLPFRNERINAGHLTVTSTGFLVAVSAPRTGLPPTEPGAITLRPKGGPFRTMAEPADTVSRMIGETLSVAVHEPSGTAAATNPDGNLVTFWRLDPPALISSLELPGARGIVLTQDGSHFMVSWGEDANLAFVPTATLRLDRAQAVAKAGFSGSHLFQWNHDALLALRSDDPHRSRV